jgi:hypothetical protein
MTAPNWTARDLQCGAPHETASRRQADRSLQTLANCAKARSASIQDRCKAVFEGLNPLRRERLEIAVDWPEKAGAAHGSGRMSFGTSLRIARGGSRSPPHQGAALAASLPPALALSSLFGKGAGGRTRHANCTSMVARR